MFPELLRTPFVSNCPVGTNGFLVALTQVAIDVVVDDVPLLGMSAIDRIDVKAESRGGNPHSLLVSFHQSRLHGTGDIRIPGSYSCPRRLLPPAPRIRSLFFLMLFLLLSWSW